MPRTRAAAAPSSQGRKKTVRPAQGWRTTDEDEIQRRRQRAAGEPLSVEALEPDHPVFGTFRVYSEAGSSYEAEIRSLSERDNSCGCPDYEVNGLGTCKHIEAVLAHVRTLRQAKTSKGRVEVFLRRTGKQPEVRAQKPAGPGGYATQELIARYFTEKGALRGDPLVRLPDLARALAAAPSRVRAGIRLSRHLLPWIEQERRKAARQKARERFLADVQSGRATLDVVRVPLYPYQREGMLHLAFTERALLADEMGLGKTVQAIAACELLRRLRGIERVLVVCPASLKGEWEEQIARFTGLPSRIVAGPRAQRLAQYGEGAFFYLANYEQILSDGDAVQERLAPDVIVLDEAQRIKNWQSRTARAVKRLRSPYASSSPARRWRTASTRSTRSCSSSIPPCSGPSSASTASSTSSTSAAGPPATGTSTSSTGGSPPSSCAAARTTSRGSSRAAPTSTSSSPGRRAGPPLRRIRKAGRPAPLRGPAAPPPAQGIRAAPAVARLHADDLRHPLHPRSRVPGLPQAGRARGDPGRAAHRARHQDPGLLRMGADARPGTREAPGDGDRLRLAHRRRDEVRRFKEDPACRLFLSTDSGGVGLNLQAANVVINFDLPWNPARLEQRIARAWRKHQTRPVRVLSLVTEGTIEHRMIPLLAGKQRLADGVLDGRGDLSEMPLPSGRRALVERLEALTGLTAAGVAAPPEPPKAADPWEELGGEIRTALGRRLLRLETHTGRDGREVLLLVAAGTVDRPKIEGILRRQFEGAASPPVLELLDRSAFEALERLIESGVLSFPAEGRRVLHAPAAPEPERDPERDRWLAVARATLGQADRKLRMATLLAGGGFPIEALPALREAVETALQASAQSEGLDLLEDLPVPVTWILERLPTALPLLDRLRADPGTLLGATEEEARSWIAGAERLVAEIGRQVRLEAHS